MSFEVFLEVSRVFAGVFTSIFFFRSSIHIDSLHPEGHLPPELQVDAGATGNLIQLNADNIYVF